MRPHFVVITVVDESGLPSLDAMREQAERAEKQILAMRQRAAQEVVRAQDEWSLIEVGCNGLGEVVEVAVNAELITQVTPSDLAEAILQATRAAQQLAQKRGQR